MKKISVVMLLLLVSMMFAGCYSVKVLPPAGKDVELMPSAKSASFKQTQKNWFVLWGIVPLNSDGVSKVIEKNNLTEVRVETKRTFVDVLISGLLNIVSVGVATTVVEGNSN